MFHSLLSPGFRPIILAIFACCLSISGKQLSAQTPVAAAPPQDGPAKTDSTAKSPPAPVGGPNEEVSSRDTPTDRKSTRLNSSHGYISYAVFCLKKKKKLKIIRMTALTNTHRITHT